MEPLIVLFQELGGSPLDFCDLVRYTAVCKSWKEAVQQRLYSPRKVHLEMSLQSRVMHRLIFTFDFQRVRTELRCS